MNDAQRYPNLLIERHDDGAILVVKINRIEYRNAVNEQTAAELYMIFTEFEHNKKAKIAILTGKF